MTPRTAFASIIPSPTDLVPSNPIDEAYFKGLPFNGEDQELIKRFFENQDGSFNEYQRLFDVQHKLIMSQGNNFSELADMLLKEKEKNEFLTSIHSFSEPTIIALAVLGAIVAVPLIYAYVLAPIIYEY